LGGSYIRLLVGGSEEFFKNGDRFQYSQGTVDLADLLGKVFMSASSNATEKKPVPSSDNSNSTGKK
ncbi:MAG: outer membrane lipid asymmetry maintenance protein MlaD, partial [Alphaproteobacteria bacterium]|nr:outer membrane lipid asymmetry maintenance protein MlaD [Alphaproteobacteria bacterium]